jgi:hypothetical protein
MKFFLFLLLFFPYQGIIAQSNVTVPTAGCPIKTVTTDPSAYNNSSNPGAMWDWRQQNFTVFLTSTDGTSGTPITIVNPFYDQSQNPNTYGFASEFDKDYKVENGWELLYKSFGSASQGISTPYFALYNRYNGTVRVFANIINSGEFPYTAAAITLEYPQTTTNYSKRQTAVLNQLGKFTYSMDELQRGANHFVPNEYINSGTTNNYFWLYADFNTLFDPCTCGLTSEWTLTIGLISHIDITASINGTQRTIVDANPSGSNPTETQVGSFFGKVQDYLTFGSGIIAGVQGVAKSGAEGKKAGEDLISTAQALALGNDEMLGVDKSKNIARILGKLLHEAPKVNMVLNLASSLISMVKKTGGDFDVLTNNDPKSLNSVGTSTITEVKTELAVDGSLEVTTPYKSAPLVVPGTQGVSLVTDSNPIYNNILGIFNLFEQPKFRLTTFNPDPLLQVVYDTYVDSEGAITYYSGDNSAFHAYPPIKQLQLLNTPKLVINPASNLKLISVEYQIVFENHIISPNYFLNGLMKPGLFDNYEDVKCFTQPWGINTWRFRTNHTNGMESFLNNIGYELDIKPSIVDNYLDYTTFSTPYLGQSCVKNTGAFSYNFFLEPRVRVKAIFEPINPNPASDVDQIIFIHSFPGQIEEMAGANYAVLGTPQLSCDQQGFIPISIDLPIDESQFIIGKPSDVLLQNETINSNIDALGDLTIGDNVILGSGNLTVKTSGNIYFDKTINSNLIGSTVNFIAGKEIIVTPEVVINPEITLSIDQSLIMPCESTIEFFPTNTEIANFCNGPVYSARSAAKNIVINTVIPEDSDNLIRKIMNPFTFTLYPNPATSETTIQLKNANFGDAVVRMYDVTGKEVFISISSPKEDIRVLNVSTLERGVYFVKVDTYGETLTKQLIVQ